jgi:hypothetical protein
MKKIVLVFLVSGLLMTSGIAEAKMTVTFGPTKLDPKVKVLGRSLLAPAEYVELALPVLKDVPVVFGDCGQVNAYYEPNNKRIVVCYELVEYLLNNVIKVFGGDADLASDAYHQAMVFVFFHEVGHAYVDLSDMETTGLDEDVADQISTYLMWALNFDSVSALGGLVFFQLDNATPLNIWDEHTPDAKRLANLACWSYGAEQVRAEDAFHAVGEKTGQAEKLEARSPRCPEEWAKIKRVWGKVVKLKAAKK